MRILNKTELYCVYDSPIDLQTDRIPFGSKSIEKLCIRYRWIQWGSKIHFSMNIKTETLKFCKDKINKTDYPVFYLILKLPPRILYTSKKSLWLNFLPRILPTKKFQKFVQDLYCFFFFSEYLFPLRSFSLTEKLFLYEDIM